MSQRSTRAKVNREIERRLKRLAEGLPVTNTWSEHRLPSPYWEIAKYKRGAYRTFTVGCECGKEHKIALLYSSRKIWWRLTGQNKKQKTVNDLLAKNRKKGDLTRAQFDEYLDDHFYEPTEKDSDETISDS